MKDTIFLGMNLQEFKDLLREEMNKALQSQTKSESKDDEMWTIVQTYKYLKITRQTLHKITKPGHLEKMKVAGKSVRYFRKDVLDYLDRCKG